MQFRDDFRPNFNREIVDKLREETFCLSVSHRSQNPLRINYQLLLLLLLATKRKYWFEFKDWSNRSILRTSGIGRSEAVTRPKLLLRFDNAITASFNSIQTVELIIGRRWTRKDGRERASLRRYSSFEAHQTYRMRAVKDWVFGLSMRWALCLSRREWIYNRLRSLMKLRVHPFLTRPVLWCIARQDDIAGWPSRVRISLVDVKSA